MHATVRHLNPENEELGKEIYSNSSYLGKRANPAAQPQAAIEEREIVKPPPQKAAQKKSLTTTQLIPVQQQLPEAQEPGDIDIDALLNSMVSSPVQLQEKSLQSAPPQVTSTQKHLGAKAQSNAPPSKRNKRSESSSSSSSSSSERSRKSRGAVKVFGKPATKEKDNRGPAESGGGRGGLYLPATRRGAATTPASRGSSTRGGLGGTLHTAANLGSNNMGGTFTPFKPTFMPPVVNRGRLGAQKANFVREPEADEREF